MSEPTKRESLPGVVLLFGAQIGDDLSRALVFDDPALVRERIGHAFMLLRAMLDLAETAAAEKP